MSLAVQLAERALLPDALLRWGIRRRLAVLLHALSAGGPAAARERERRLAEAMRASPIALAPDAANAQHYEVPAAFFQTFLGPLMKYSCCLWEEGVESLEDAEQAMLRLVADRAGLANGMDVLDLGCGWGSFCLWAGERFPQSRFTAITNSRAQSRYIGDRVARTGLHNVCVLTANVAEFQPDRSFDRVVSIEMFEHVRNVEALLARIASWLRRDGRLFLHVFSHREHAYTFDEEPSSWMGSEFFTGGMMPTESLYLGFQRDLLLLERWTVEGTHYARTLRAWLDRLDARRETALAALSPGRPGEGRWRLQRWRIFLMACEEAFGYAGGTEWRVSHCLFGVRP